MFFSSNEWDPLKKVVVGNDFGRYNVTFDISLKHFYKHVSYMYLRACRDESTCFYKKEYIDELHEDVEGFVDTLKKLGIEVYRPSKFKTTKEIVTPNWKSYSVPPLNIRDMTILIDNVMLESAPVVRGRYFENDYLKDIFYEHYLSGGNWLVMPRPMMLDSSYDNENETNISKYMVEPDPSAIKSDIKRDNVEKYEIMFDAAQMIRFNDDILVNIANRNHAMAINWLKMNFPNKRFHIVHSVTDNHLDSFYVPLKEGVMLLRHEMYKDSLPDFLKKWKILVAPEPSHSNFPDYDFQYCPVLTSNYIDSNVLSIDGDKIIVNSLYPELIALLEKNKFTPIPVRHRHRKIFGGGFHCFTLDLLREPA